MRTFRIDETPLLPTPTPTPTQPHPKPSYLVRLRFTHAEAEAIKAAVARRCVLSLWAPASDNADWALQQLVVQILDQQGVRKL